MPLFVRLVDGYPRVFAPLTEAGNLWQETLIYLNELDPDRALRRDEDRVTDVQRISSQGNSLSVFCASHSCGTFYHLRIVYSMRYNATYNRASAQKAARAGVRSTYTNLTQPTGVSASWAGWDSITSQSKMPLVGFTRGFLILTAGSRAECPTKE